MPSPITAELAQLARLAREGGLDLSQVSLRVKTDLLLSLAAPPPDDLAAYAEIATAIIPTVDEQTVLILARKLAGWALTPEPVLHALRARGDLALAALLGHGMPAARDEIEALAEHGAESVALALAARSDLTPAAAILLVARDDRDIDLALLANSQAPLPRGALDRLVERGRAEPGYARLLLARTDLSHVDLAPLYLLAGPERRLAILDSLRALDSLSPAERRPALPPIVFEGWLALAAEDAPGAFGAIGDHLGGGPELGEALAADRSRELLGFSLIAAGASVEDATRLLIRLGDATAHSVPRIFGLVALMRALHPSLAARLLAQAAAVTLRQQGRGGRRLPAMAAGGTPARQGAAETRQPVVEIMRKLGLRA